MARRHQSRQYNTPFGRRTVGADPQMCCRVVAGSGSEPPGVGDVDVIARFDEKLWQSGQIGTWQKNSHNQLLESSSGLQKPNRF